MERTYYKVVGITIDSLSAEIVADRNVKNIDEAGIYIKQNIDTNKNATWLILPCSCKF